MNTCIATIPSLNICIRAQKALSAAGIFSKIVSIDPKLTRRGCAYGIEFRCEDERKIRGLLRHARVSFSQIINYDGGRPI